MVIAIIGGTGDMGFGLGLRFANISHEIIFGSRFRENAIATANRAKSILPSGKFRGDTNRNAANNASLVVIAVPAKVHRLILEDLRPVLNQKKILDVTVPIGFNPLRYAPPPEGSNALETQAVLGESHPIACAFHTVSATLLLSIEKKLTGTTLVASNNKELKKCIIELANDIGLNAFDAGSLNLASSLESLTPMLLGLNKKYGSNHLGITIEGL